MSAARLLRALGASVRECGCAADFDVAATRPWASALFVGARYDVAAVLPAGAAAEGWIAALPDADLPMPGQFASEVRVLDRIDGAEAIRLVLEALVLED